MQDLSQGTKNLVDAIVICRDARLQAHHVDSAWLYFKHAEDHLQKQLSALLREAEEAA